MAERGDGGARRRRSAAKAERGDGGARRRRSAATAAALAWAALPARLAERLGCQQSAGWGLPGKGGGKGGEGSPPLGRPDSPSFDAAMKVLQQKLGHYCTLLRFTAKYCRL